MTGPLIALVHRQAARIRRQVSIIDHQQEQIDGLTARLRRIQSDVELIGACIPRERREDALALVRDRHRIEDGDIVEEAG